MTHWPTATLADLTATTRPICYGVLKPGPYVSDGPVLLRIQDLEGNRVDTRTAHRIGDELDDEFRRSRLRGGEVLLSIQGTVGRVALCPPGLAGANISRTLAVIEPDRRLLPPFLRYFLLYLAAGHRFEVGGTTRASLNISTIRAIQVPLPSIEEQRRIVDILEDHLSRLDAADSEMRAVMRRTALLEAGALAEVWQSATQSGACHVVSDLGVVVTGSTPSTRSGEVFGSDMPFATPSDIGRGRLVDQVSRGLSSFGAGSARLLSPHSVLAVCIGATLGKIGWTDRELATNQQVNALTPRPEFAIAEFVAALMASPQFQADMHRNASNTTMPILNKSRFSRLALPIPSRADQQLSLARLKSWRDSIDRLDDAARASRGRSTALRRALLEAAISGRLTSRTSDDEPIGRVESA